MTQEDRELLLKDLSARLPYGVKFLRESWNYEWDQEMSVVETLEDIDNEGYINHTRVYKVEDIKPYLRPMSSMTEEEEEEYHKTMAWSGDIFNEKIGIWVPTINSSDYLIAHHFDYRGLIPKGLALEAPEGMYK